MRNRIKELTRERRYRAAYVARGLRSDGKPRAKRKPCGCLSGRCLKCMKKAGSYWTNAEVAEMRSDYESGMSARAVERKYGAGKKGLKSIFTRRGIPYRPFKKIPRQANGSPQRYIPKSQAEIDAMIAAAPRLNVPEALKFEWRRWSWTKRQWFICLMRRRFPSTRPIGPFSKNVVPFIYGDAQVLAIAERMNAGRTSRDAVISIKPSSEGVIYRDKIYFWTSDSYCQGTKWTPEFGRPQLNHVIWEEANGRPVPEKFTVVHADGNKNNFLPNNLKLRSMAECALMNSIQNQWKRNPTAQNLARHKQLMEKVVLGRQRRRTAIARNQTAALLQDFQSPNKRGLITALGGRDE